MVLIKFTDHPMRDLLIDETEVASLTINGNVLERKELAPMFLQFIAFLAKVENTSPDPFPAGGPVNQQMTDKEMLEAAFRAGMENIDPRLYRQYSGAAMSRDFEQWYVKQEAIKPSRRNVGNYKQNDFETRFPNIT